jgi:hypothetical protein
LSAAEADADAWKALLVIDPPSALTEEEQDRVELIEVGMGKLQRAVSAPLGREFVRAWKTADAQMIVDASRMDAVGSGLLLRGLTDARIDLHHADKGRPLRQEPAALRDSTLEASEPRRQIASGDDAWPAVFHDQLAVMPVPGGLICRGLGIERYGGYRLWERAVPDWPGLPRNFEDTAAAGAQGVYFSPRSGRVAHLDWHSGRLLWERDFPDRQVERVFLTGRRLLVLTTDRHLFSMDAVFGDDLRSMALGESAEQIAEVGGRVLTWGSGGVRSFDAASLRPEWTIPAPGVDRFVALHGRELIAYRSAADLGWVIVDPADGSVILRNLLPDFATIDVWVCRPDGGSIIAGRKSAIQASDTLALAALSLSDGRLGWETQIQSLVSPTPSQLAAHAGLIPILVLRAAADGDGVDRRSLAIQLIDLQSGESIGPVQIDSNFPDGPNPGPVSMVCTPTRMFVQAYASVVAFGSWTGTGP